MFKGKLSAAVIFGVACLAGVNAQATTTSYTFTEGGWTDQSGHVGTLDGTFTGTTEANGEILMQDLTSFQANFHETVNGQPNTFIFNLANSTDFSYDTTTGLLNFADGSAQSGIQICSGSAATNAICFGIPVNSGASTVYSGFFEDLPLFGPLTTRLGATVTGAPTATPEPKSVGLIAAAGGLFLAFGCLRKRAQQMIPRLTA